MSGGWAEKLTNASASNLSNVSNVSSKPVTTLPSSTSAAIKSKKPHPVNADSLQPNTFNGKEILHYLSTSYNTHLQHAKEDKEGENINSTGRWNRRRSGRPNPPPPKSQLLLQTPPVQIQNPNTIPKTLSGTNGIALAKRMVI